MITIAIRRAPIDEAVAALELAAKMMPAGTTVTVKFDTPKPATAKTVANPASSPSANGKKPAKVLTCADCGYEVDAAAANVIAAISRHTQANHGRPVSTAERTPKVPA